MIIILKLQFIHSVFKLTLDFKNVILLPLLFLNQLFFSETIFALHKNFFEKPSNSVIPSQFRYFKNLLIITQFLFI